MDSETFDEATEDIVDYDDLISFAERMWTENKELRAENETLKEKGKDLDA